MGQIYVSEKEVKMKKICMFLVLCLVAMVAYGQADSKDIPTMDIKAVGPDLDIGRVDQYSARTSIEAEVVLDENGNPLLLKKLIFSIEIYDETGEKVYMIEGVLLVYAEVEVLPYWPCDVRKVNWTDIWHVVGLGKVKTTDVDIEIEYRGTIITLPNTHGRWVFRKPIIFGLVPLGEHTEGVWSEGGWAFAGVPTSITTNFGGVTYLTKYMEK
jgi:hypothetical protein